MLHKHKWKRLTDNRENKILKKTSYAQLDAVVEIQDKLCAKCGKMVRFKRIVRKEWVLLERHWNGSELGEPKEVWRWSEKQIGWAILLTITIVGILGIGALIWVLAK